MVWTYCWREYVKVWWSPTSFFSFFSKIHTTTTHPRPETTLETLERYLPNTRGRYGKGTSQSSREYCNDDGIVLLCWNVRQQRTWRSIEASAISLTLPIFAAKLWCLFRIGTPMYRTTTAPTVGSWRDPVENPVLCRHGPAFGLASQSQTTKKIIECKHDCFSVFVGSHEWSPSSRIPLGGVLHHNNVRTFPDAPDHAKCWSSLVQ